MKPYGVDRKGYIVNNAAKKNIDSSYKQLIKEVQSEIKETVGNQMHSLYLYGSVATGNAKIRTSDIDFLLLFHRKPTKKTLAGVKNIELKFSEKYKKLVREVGISTSYTSEVNKDKYGLGCFIKHLCILLYGENYSNKFSSFKPSKLVASAFNGDIKKASRTYATKITKTDNPKDIQLFCSQISRKYIRTGFSLVTEREQSWTTDLTDSYNAFIKYYPEQKESMKKALLFARKPTTDKTELLKYTKTFGKWLNSEVKHELH